jgi:putative nucleotidyltransferase with HDIG domain
MIFAEINVMDTLFWNRFMVIGSMGMPIAFFGYAQDFLMRDRRVWLHLGYLSYLITQISNAMGSVITDAYVLEGRLFNEYGGGIVISGATWAFFVLFLSFDLTQEYRKSEDAFYRNRIKYLLVVMVLTFAGSLTNLTDLQVLPVDIAFNTVSALLISYAILRHRLLDITFVLRRGLLYSIPTIIIGAGYFLIISLALNIFQWVSGTSLFLLSLTVAVITAMVVQPLRERAQSWIDKLFFREKYDSGKMLQRISKTATTDLDLDRLSNSILREILTTLHVERAAFFLKDDRLGDYLLISQKGIEYTGEIKLSAGHPIVLRLSMNKGVLTKTEMDVAPLFRSLWGREREELEKIGARLFVPLQANDELVGILSVGEKLSGEPYSQDDRLILTTLANQTVVAIEKARLYAVAQQELAERKRAEKQLQLQLQRLNALHAIDVSITTSVNLDFTLRVLLDQVIEQLQVDAAAVLLLNPETNVLEYAESKGFHTSALQFTKLDLGDGLSGRAARDQAIVNVPDLTKVSTPLERSPLLAEEGFVTYYGAPIIAKGEVKGVLEIFHRASLNPDSEWMDFLESLTTETAIVVDNASLFADLQQSNLELERAYVTTLEGWSRALEMRDRETEGHSQRVTEMTIRLARYLGVKEDALVHIQRGALLHDIGKMGVPDSILLKPGPLSPDEMEQMRKHTVYGHELLSTIPFLQPASEIPYCHHEKWDGTGYPRELKGEEIPLAARIFAIVDVWDALLSDRPYRNAWTREDAFTYIWEESNKHFDPQVVEAFLRIIGDIEDKSNRIDKELVDNISGVLDNRPD